MASDDFRVRVTCEDAEGLLENLHLSATSAEELADELKGQRLAVTRDDDTVFVYTDTRAQAEAVLPFVEGHGDVVIEHWLADEERWDDEPTHPSSDEDLIERGYAPWEVHVECESVDAARELEAQLEERGILGDPQLQVRDRRHRDPRGGRRARRAVPRRGGARRRARVGGRTAEPVRPDFRRPRRQRHSDLDRFPSGATPCHHPPAIVVGKSARICDRTVTTKRGHRTAQIPVCCGCGAARLTQR